MAGTTNCWSNQIAGSYNQIILNAGVNGVAISTDNSAATVSVATGGAVKTTTLGSTNTTSTTTVQSGSGVLNVTATGGALTINSGVGALAISNDASATTLTIGTGGAVKNLTMGSTNTTSATVIQSGTAGLSIAATNGTLTISSGTGIMAIGNDSTAQTIGFATGAGAKVITVGTTNGASSLALKYGTADFTLASATGTVMSALDTGEITYPLQSAFLGELQTTVLNVTGQNNLFTLGNTTALIEIFDQNSDFNPTGGTFTAPVTAKYAFSGAAFMTGLTVATIFTGIIATSNRNYYFIWSRAASGTAAFCYNSNVMADMDAADVCNFIISTQGEAGVTDDVFGGVGAGTVFNGYLVC